MCNRYVQLFAILIAIMVLEVHGQYVIHNISLSSTYSSLDLPNMIQGRLDVYADDGQAAILVCCDGSLSDRDTQVMCRELGYDTEDTEYRCESLIVGDLHKQMVFDITCCGSESRLVDCEYVIVEANKVRLKWDCTHYMTLACKEKEKDVLVIVLCVVGVLVVLFVIFFIVFTKLKFSKKSEPTSYNLATISATQLQETAQQQNSNSYVANSSVT